jgi:hypothetical protein
MKEMYEGGRHSCICIYAHKGIISSVKRVQFVSDRMSYKILRGDWCDIIVLNIYAPTKDKIDYVKDSFYEELQCPSWQGRHFQANNWE